MFTRFFLENAAPIISAIDDFAPPTSLPIDVKSPSSSSCFTGSSSVGISGGRREGFSGFWYGGGMLDNLAFTGLSCSCSCIVKFALRTIYCKKKTSRMASLNHY
jgi:hypothetical protein